MSERNLDETVSEEFLRVVQTLETRWRGFGEVKLVSLVQTCNNSLLPPARIYQVMVLPKKGHTANPAIFEGWAVAQRVLTPCERGQIFPCPRELPTTVWFYDKVSESPNAAYMLHLYYLRK